MAKKSKREIIKLKSSETTHMYWKKKNKINTPGRMELRKYDPIARKHVLYKEAK